MNTERLKADPWQNACPSFLDDFVRESEEAILTKVHLLTIHVFSYQSQLKTSSALNTERLKADPWQNACPSFLDDFVRESEEAILTKVHF